MEVLKDEKLNDKIDRYQKILHQEGEYRIASSSLHVKLSDASREHTQLSESIGGLRDELIILKSKVLDESVCGKLDSIKKKISEQIVQ